MSLPLRLRPVYRFGHFHVRCRGKRLRLIVCVALIIWKYRSYKGLPLVLSTVANTACAPYDRFTS
jgi:hypothetical protein